MEILRDPSHTQALAVTELFDLVKGSGLKVDEATIKQSQLEVGMDLIAWMDSTKTSPENEAKIVEAFEAELQEGDAKQFTGMHAYRDEAGRICFKHKYTEAYNYKTFGYPQKLNGII